MSNSQHLERVLTERLRAAGADGRVRVAAETIASLRGRFDDAIAAILAAELKDLPAAALQDLPDSPMSTWLAAQSRMDAGDAAGAAESWQRFFQQRARRDPIDLASYARCLADTGRFDAAAQQLRLALSQPVPYSFFARTEKLCRRVAAETAAASLRQCRVAVLGTSTTSFLIPVLQALCLRDRIHAAFYEGLFGAMQQEILDPQSGLARFQPNVVLLGMNWRDLQLEAVTPDPARWIDDFVASLQTSWSRLSEAFGCHVVQHAFDYPAAEPYGYLAGSLPGGRLRLIEQLNLRLREVAPPHVSVLDVPAVQRECGAAVWSDPMAWAHYRQHPANAALPALAEAQAAHLHAVLGLTRKVLVTDLDHTLWGGVIGEDGLAGIKIGPGSPAGEEYLRLQRYLLDLKNRGILLVVCSKNNPDDARLPFEQHQGMALRLDDFAVFRANWEDKAANIRAAAQELSLGLDSFVFLDDNPLEREWVRTSLPQVAVVELGPNVFHYVHDLDRARYFHALSLSSEDLQRAGQYRIEAQRESLRASTASLEEFLSQLQLRAAVLPVSDAHLARVTQLINKTNQFNLTSRRYTEGQVKHIAADPSCWAAAFEMSDRMGSYGLIGVMLCRPAGGPAPAWEVDTWLMSCRTLGRQMERFMFDRLLEAARERGIRRLIGVYRPTQKNVLVRDLYEKLGWEPAAKSSDEDRYLLDVPAEPVVTATHVRDVTPRPAIRPDGESPDEPAGRPAG
jgi:FkbH-like protein